jgi:hypothetical protein
MSLVHNKFEVRPEIIFINYDEIIKSPYPYLLNKIDTTLRQFYEPFLDVDKFKGLNLDNLLRFCTQRTDKQLFRYLSKVDFDVDGALKELKDRYMDLYDKSPLLSMGESIKMLLTQKFTEKIYIYSEIYDRRIHLDIQTLYNDMERVNYVCGNFKEVIQSLDGITSYIVNDIDYIHDIFEAKKADYTHIMLASYAYNYAMNEDESDLEFRIDLKDLTKDIVCKIASFTPVDFEEKHFSQLTDNV